MNELTLAMAYVFRLSKHGEEVHFDSHMRTEQEQVIDRAVRDLLRLAFPRDGIRLRQPRASWNDRIAFDARGDDIAWEGRENYNTVFSRAYALGFLERC
jgi:hypothetical protein